MPKPKIRISRGPGHFILKAKNQRALEMLAVEAEDHEILSRKGKEFYLNLIGLQNRKTAIAMLNVIHSWEPIYYADRYIYVDIKNMFLEFIEHYTTDPYFDSKILLINLSPVHMQGFVSKTEAIQIVKARSGQLLDQYSISYSDKTITIFQQGD